MTAPLRVVVIEDDPRYRRSLEALFGQTPGFALARAYGSARPALDDADAAVRCGRPLPWDLVLMDLQLPGVSGIDATRRMKPLIGAVPIVILTVFEEPATIVQAICAGAVIALARVAAQQPPPVRVPPVQQPRIVVPVPRAEERATDVQERIATRRLDIVDKDGRRIGSLADTGHRAAALTLFDRSGRTTLSATGGATPLITLYDPANRVSFDAAPISIALTAGDPSAGKPEPIFLVPSRPPGRDSAGRAGSLDVNHWDGRALRTLASIPERALRSGSREDR
jgi:CheY-like chemotaxis protein